MDCDRTALAQQLRQALLPGDAHNGLFLAAPRHTGKSTSLQGNLALTLQQADAEVVCVGLRADTASRLSRSKFGERTHGLVAN